MAGIWQSQINSMTNTLVINGKDHVNFFDSSDIQLIQELSTFWVLIC